MEINLSKNAEMSLLLLKEHLHTSDTEIIEEAILHLFHKYQEEIVDSKQPVPLIEVMEKSGLLD